MPQTRKKLLFLFDFISPYAYLGWTQIHALAARHGAAVTARPVLFAAMLNANDTRGPAEIPAKRSYIFRDLLRTAAHLGLTLVPPPSHPFNPLLALRVAGLEMDEETRHRLISALYQATWGGGPGITDPDVVDQIAQDVGVPDALARARQPETKQRLRTHTEQAITDGVFGVPSIIVDEELFWGYDSFRNLERHLNGTVVLDDALFERWTNLPAGAQRKRS